MTDVAVDTDVVLKIASYRLAREMLEVVGPRGVPSVLGLTHLIAPRQLARRKGLRDRDGATRELEALLGMAQRLEPDDAEIEAAADLASAAQEKGLPLDTGEAQLAAIVVRRGLPLLITGDKRAIGALCALVEDGQERAALTGRIACFEQLIASIADLIGPVETRSRICAEPDMDGAMGLACSCDRPAWDPVQLAVACESFVRAVRQQAGELLLEGSSLT